MRAPLVWASELVAYGIGSWGFMLICMMQGCAAGILADNRTHRSSFGTASTSSCTGCQKLGARCLQQQGSTEACQLRRSHARNAEPRRGRVNMPHTVLECSVGDPQLVSLDARDSELLRIRQRRMRGSTFAYAGVVSCIESKISGPPPLVVQSLRLPLNEPIMNPRNPAPAVAILKMGTA